MNFRFVSSLLLAGAVLAVACIDMSAPKGPAAISVLLLPSPSVVVNDTMRDSLGHAVPLLVHVYNSEGLPVTDVPPQFFIIDSAPLARVTPAGFLIAGSRVGSVRILGQVNQLQTPLVTIPVTVRPNNLTLGVTPDTFFVPLSGDTTKRTKLPLPVVVTGDTGTAPNIKTLGSQGMIVHYALLSAPASTNPGFAAVYIGDASGNPRNVDTTDASGTTRNTYLVVVPARLAQTGSATVNVTSSYADSLVPGSNKKFVIPIQPSAAASFSTTLRR